MGKKSEFYIQFTGLSDGKHDYHFKIDDTFFTNFDYSDIEGANLAVKMVLDKRPDMLIADFQIEGTLTVMCDRCTDNCDVHVKGDDEIIFKFTEEEIDDEKIIAVLPNEFGIDVSNPIFEISSLLLPSKRLHEAGKCNQEMLDVIDDYLIVEEKKDNQTNEETDQDNDDVDPRWSALKNLK
jgi:uncharacterized protein